LILFDYNQYKLLGFAFMALHSLFLVFSFTTKKLTLTFYPFMMPVPSHNHYFKQESAFSHSDLEKKWL